ncbi:hypothetical protein M0804_000465 [Polistes exclamans]|nr:hypothetical protein M0804_000465 [Polistes exclamans]
MVTGQIASFGHPSSTTSSSTTSSSISTSILTPIVVLLLEIVPSCSAKTKSIIVNSRGRFGLFYVCDDNDSCRAVRFLRWQVTKPQSRSDGALETGIVRSWNEDAVDDDDDDDDVEVDDDANDDDDDDADDDDDKEKNDERGIDIVAILFSARFDYVDLEQRTLEKLSSIRTPRTTDSGKRPTNAPTHFLSDPRGNE